MSMRIIWELYRRTFAGYFLSPFTRKDFIPRGGESMNVYDLLSLFFMGAIAFVAIADYIERKAKNKRRPRRKVTRRLRKK